MLFFDFMSKFRRGVFCKITDFAVLLRKTCLDKDGVGEPASLWEVLRSVKSAQNHRFCDFCASRKNLPCRYRVNCVAICASRKKRSPQPGAKTHQKTWFFAPGCGECVLVGLRKTTKNRKNHQKPGFLDTRAKTTKNPAESPVRAKTAKKIIFSLREKADFFFRRFCSDRFRLLASLVGGFVKISAKTVQMSHLRHVLAPR